MDFGVSNDGSHIYCLDSNGFLGNAGGDPSVAAKAKTNTLFLEHIETEKINFDPKKAVSQIALSRPLAPPQTSNH